MNAPQPNPFEVLTEVEDQQPGTVFSTTGTSLGRTIVVWTLICSISAVPGFLWGYQFTQGRIAGMLAGVLLFIVCYVIGDYLTRGWWYRRNEIARKTLVIGYWTRIVASIIFPIGMGIDLFPGLFAFQVTMLIFGGGLAEGAEQGTPFIFLFLHSFLTTVLTGIFINFVLAAYMLLIFAAWHAIRSLRRIPAA